MKDAEAAHYPPKDARTAWLKYALMILVAEKIIQHIFVTVAFYFNWGAISASVVVNPSVLMILGAIVAILFLLSLWGLITQQKWAANLVIGLALFDLLGEFVAQGTVIIAITVSFVVATILLILSLLYHRQDVSRTV
jgi:hypothetical protein